ncbi:superinfection immunity protein [Enterococcus hulanensis]|uniref:superinfection immunity protein n=1 Tax=Enterococcus hulanensis TaxID=2559929 RepID=UPI0010F56BF4|nr:superinfection immunity protein [Enterococcus hulanensis]
MIESLGVFLVLLGLGIYMIPTIIALITKKNIVIVAILNIFLGWTLIGFVIALVFAFSGKTTKEKDLDSRLKEAQLAQLEGRPIPKAPLKENPMDELARKTHANYAVKPKK